MSWSCQLLVSNFLKSSKKSTPQSSEEEGYLVSHELSTEINATIRKSGDVFSLIKINILGEINKFSPGLKSTLKKTIFLTRKNKKILVNLAINYGSKIEILKAFKKTKKKLNMKNFEKNLYTKNMSNPDILIRTGGHQRLSNFMLWQLAYA